MVVLGESTAAGACATEECCRWANVAADLISQYQGRPIRLENRGIGANCISPRSPGYVASRKPSALERYREDVIAFEPDLFILAYGLNDMRAGMPLEAFREDMSTVLSEVRGETSAVCVLTTVYHMIGFELHPPWNRGGREPTRQFNRVIRELAEQHGAVLADIHEAMAETDWMVDPDCIHANDLGHRVIGNRIFEALAQRCSCLSRGT